MFWGLIMEPGKKYSQTVEKSFHISQAALDLHTIDSDSVQVLLGFEGRNYLLCTLQKGKSVQVSLDLNFQAGDTVSFATNGPGHVHLTGYLVPEDMYENIEEDEEEEEAEEEEEPLEEMSPPASKKRKASTVNNKHEPERSTKKSKTELLLDQYAQQGSDDSDDSDVNTDVLEDSSDDEGMVVGDEVEDEEDGAENEDSDDDENADSDDEDESEEEEVKVVQKPQKSPKKDQVSTPKQNGVVKKEKQTPKQEKTPKHDKSVKQGKDKTPGAAEKTPKNDKQKGDKKHDGQKTPGAAAAAGTTPKKLEGGVVIEDIKVGEGPVAKNGKFVTVYYEGRLKNNNKMFDSSTKGPGFKFRLGKQEVIKGWDIGVAGMKLGGKRRISCPPHMAYGAQGSPPVIPPNSTLIFEVEMKNVK